MFGMMRRNIKLFFRDRAGVLFSLLAVFIVIGLYILFLGDTMRSGMEGVKGLDFLMNSWVMAGILAVTSVTTTLGAFGIMVEDRSKKIQMDFSVSPIKRPFLAGGYIFGAMFVGIIMSVVTFLLAEIYIVTSGGTVLPFDGILKVLGVILLSVFASSSMLFFLASFLKSSSAFAAASTVIGTLIGFLMGIYIPLGVLPAPVQMLVKLFPISHAAALFRQVMLDAPMAASFQGAPTEMLNEFQTEMGVVFHYGGFTADVLTSVLVLLGTGILFYGLSIFSISRKKSGI